VAAMLGDGCRFQSELACDEDRVAQAPADLLAAARTRPQRPDVLPSAAGDPRRWLEAVCQPGRFEDAGRWMHSGESAHRIVHQRETPDPGGRRSWRSVNSWSSRADRGSRRLSPGQVAQARSRRAHGCRWCGFARHREANWGRCRCSSSGRWRPTAAFGPRITSGREPRAPGCRPLGCRRFFRQPSRRPQPPADPVPVSAATAGTEACSARRRSPNSSRRDPVAPENTSAGRLSGAGRPRCGHYPGCV
jgi:hypothetical protein